MDGIINLTEINYTTLMLWIFMILIGGKQILDIKDYYKKRYRIKTGIDTDKETIEDRISTLEKHDKFQYEQIKKISSGIEDIQRQLLDKEIEDIRGTILDFGTNLSNGKKYNKEAFDRVMRLHEKYEKILQEHNMKNGLVSETMKYISEVYHEKLKDGF